MKKVFLAGIAVACMLAMGTTALAAETIVPRRIRAHGACHRQLDILWQKDCVRHDCTYVDADGDGICDSCSWHEDRHHCLDENGYCLNSACNYENCGYGHGTGYCRGYCNSVTVGAGTVSYPETLPDAGSNGGVNATDTAQENGGGQNSPAAAQENGASGGGYGNGAGYSGGYGNNGHHGGGHHGGHH